MGGSSDIFGNGRTSSLVLGNRRQFSGIVGSLRKSSEIPGIVVKWPKTPWHHARFIFKLSLQQIQWGRDRHKHFWNSRGYIFVSFKDIDTGNSTWFQKYFRVSVSMVTSHMTLLRPVKKSKLPNVSPSKVCNLKLWYFWRNTVHTNWRTCPIWILKFHFCDVTTDDVAKWVFWSCAVLIKKWRIWNNKMRKIQ